MNYIHKWFFKYVYITLNWCQFRVSLINTNLHFVSVEFWWYNKTKMHKCKYKSKGSNINLKICSNIEISIYWSQVCLFIQ